MDWGKHEKTRERKKVCVCVYLRERKRVGEKAVCRRIERERKGQAGPINTHGQPRSIV